MKYLLPIVFVVSACSPSWHLKQAEKHLKKTEIKGASVRVDTIYKSVEVIKSEIRVDTVFRHVNFRDTIMIHQDKILVRVKVDTLLHEVFVDAKCESDTVRIQVPVQVVKEIKTGWPWWWLLVAALAGGGLVAIAVLRRSQR